MIRDEEEAAAPVKLPPEKMPAETAEYFSRTYTEAVLGLAINVGGADRGERIIVKRVMPNSASSKKRIPVGAIVNSVNGVSTVGCSLAEVQTMFAEGERPLTIEFWQHGGSKLKTAPEAEQRPLETALTFSRTFHEQMVGLALTEGPRLGPDLPAGTIVKRTLPQSAAEYAGVPAGVYVTAINFRPTEGLSLKQVQKLVRDSSRPVTLFFATEPA